MGGSIAHFIANLLLGPTAPGLIPGIHKKFSEEKAA